MKLVLRLSFVVFFLISPKLGLCSNKEFFPKNKSQNGQPYFGFDPYLPLVREYDVELGAMWEDQTMYWVGGRVGFHVGRCMFSGSQTCQQYWDLLGGVGGRDGSTNGLLLTGPRWQFVNYPNILSPAISLYVGAMTLSDANRSKEVLTYGIGYSITMAVHENLDLRLQLRAGGGDKEWSQGFVGLGIKIDNLVTYYANKLNRLKEGAVDKTTTVIKGTVKGAGSVLKGTGEVLQKTIKGLAPKDNSIKK